MINKYLKELVENNNRIIIPDFGAFMVQSTPDGKQISFNDFLKFNDGLLVNQIIKAEKISKNDASAQIKTFVKNIESTFVKGDAYELNDLGFLVKDDNGNIKFEKELAQKKNIVPQTDAKPTIVLDENKAEKKEAAKPAAKKVESKKEVAAKATAPKAETKVAPVAEKKPVAPSKAESTPKTTAKPNVKPEAIKPEATPPKPVVNKPVAQKGSTTTKSAEAIAAEIVNKNKKSNGSNNSIKLILIVVAAIIVLGGGGWALWHYGAFDKSAPVVEAAPVPEPVIDTTPAVDTTPVIEEEPKIIEEPAIDPNAKHYYIVAGSFKVATNADNYNQELIDEGYESEIVIRSNGFNTVTYKTLYDWNEALREWRNLRSVNEQTWILIK